MASAGDDLELKVSPRPSTRSIRLLTATCVVGLLLGIAGLVVPNWVGSRDEFASDRQAVITRSSDFAVTFNTFTADGKADYHRRLKPLMTPAFYRKTVKITNLLFEVVEDREHSSGGVKVISVAVDRIDKDSASAVIAFDASVRRGDTDKAVPRAFRWQIDLRKSRNKWLVAQADDVVPIEATLGDVTQDDESGAAE